MMIFHKKNGSILNPERLWSPLVLKDGILCLNFHASFIFYFRQIAYDIDFRQHITVASTTDIFYWKVDQTAQLGNYVNKGFSDRLIVKEIVFLLIVLPLAVFYDF